MKSKTYSTHSLLPIITDAFDYQSRQAISKIVRSKVSTYTNFKIKNQNFELTLTRKKSKSKRQRIISNIRQLPPFNTMEQLFNVEKQLSYVFKQRLNSNFEEGLYVCMKLLKIAIDHECSISKRKLDVKRSVIVESFIFVSQILTELGFQRLGFYFGAISVQLGQIYRNCLEIGRGLIILSKIARKANKFRDAIILLKKAIQYLWMSRNNHSADFEIQAYNELSYNFLQSNMGEQSKIFAEKYQTGFLESQDSKILNLSKELITSLHNRLPKWYKLKPDTFTLVFKFNIDQILEMHKKLLISSPIDQNLFLKKLNIEYDLYYENFMKHEMFFYEIPLPLEFKKSVNKINNQKLSTSSTKFILKKRSKSNPIFKIYKQNQKIKQTIIFNYRGIGIATKKLMNMLAKLINLFRTNTNKISNESMNQNRQDFE